MQMQSESLVALRGFLADAIARAERLGQTQWLAIRWPIQAQDVLPAFAASEDEGFYWEAPDEGLCMLALGRVHEIDTQGASRFEEASRRSRSLFDNLSLFALDAELRPDSAARFDSKGPLLVGGFAFLSGDEGRPGKAGGEAQRRPLDPWQGFGPGSLVLPERLLLVRGREAWCTYCVGVEGMEDLEICWQQLRQGMSASLPVPAESASLQPVAEEGWEPGPEYRVRSDRSHQRYCAQVASALAAIESAHFDKVVLARALDVTHVGDFALTAFLESLREIHPSCVVLALRRGERCFVSATPERLVALEGDELTTAAVAGSAARGRNPDEERALGDALLASEKEQVEHELVRRAITAALTDLCSSVVAGDAPRLLRLEGIQHLETPITGQLIPGSRKSINILDLVGRLHPTPAVGGCPRDSALDWLLENEQLDRGWYTGPVGYLDARGDGEFRVALRSGLLHGGRARLFAGAGIVAGSRPEAELAETRLKLRALLAPLTEI